MKIVTNYKILLGGALLALLIAQNVAVAGPYDDVAIVVNINSTASNDIGQYFKNARSVPDENVIYVAASTAEEIDSDEFDYLRSQIENHLSVNNLANSINYIVTTKGVPLKVNRGNTFSTSSPSSSVESELALMFGPYSSYIGQSGRISCPYYYQTQAFSHTQHGMYLVTRLDAYTVQQVFDLIDRSGPGVTVPLNAAFVLDQDPAWNDTAPSLNTNLVTAGNVLRQKGKNVRLDSTLVYQVNHTNVVGYTSWGSNDHNAVNYTQYGIPHNGWTPGAIAETYVSTSGRSFETPPVYGQSLVADLVAEGAAGVKGYVYEPFSSSMALAQILFDRYTSGFNLAESYYMASRYVSWMDVVVGDPKTTIEMTNNPLPVQLKYFTIDFVPTARRVKLVWGTSSETNNYGFCVQRRGATQSEFADVPGSFVPGHGTTLEPQVYGWSDSTVASGTYMYRLKQIDLDGAVHFSDAREVRVSMVTAVTEISIPEKFGLDQNFPNPFNPSTHISYDIPTAGMVILKVFSEIGEEVSTLVSEWQEQGRHAALFEAGRGPSGQGSALASGVYFYRLEAAGHLMTRKMMFLK